MTLREYFWFLCSDLEVKKNRECVSYFKNKVCYFRCDNKVRKFYYSMAVLKSFEKEFNLLPIEGFVDVYDCIEDEIGFHFKSNIMVDERGRDWNEIMKYLITTIGSFKGLGWTVQLAYTSLSQFRKANPSAYRYVLRTSGSAGVSELCKKYGWAYKSRKKF